MPRFTREETGLSGVNLSTDLLTGADRSRLESFRERADRASCACLLLIEAEPQRLGWAEAEKAVERLLRVVEAAHILGCTAVAVKIDAPDADDAVVRVASRLKAVVERAEKRELNILISPHLGLTERPERVTELLKKVGGFRIGTFPDFEGASKARDAGAYLHRLTPYATVVGATTHEFVPTGRKGAEASVEAFREGLWTHKSYDLSLMVRAIRGVGYDGPVGIDYRGAGDVTMGVRMSRDAILAALADEQDENGDSAPKAEK
ncbi:MAG TPA: TIM barrel protein [Dehalococcoidia bacterium]|nr:TIM barrel protein [Dehalococcoidia bacterium]